MKDFINKNYKNIKNEEIYSLISKQESEQFVEMNIPLTNAELMK